MIYVWEPCFDRRVTGEESPSMAKDAVRGRFRPQRPGEIGYNHVPVADPVAGQPHCRDCATATGRGR